VQQAGPATGPRMRGGDALPTTQRQLRHTAPARASQDGGADSPQERIDTEHHTLVSWLQVAKYLIRYRIKCKAYRTALHRESDDALIH